MRAMCSQQAARRATPSRVGVARAKGAAAARLCPAAAAPRGAQPRKDCLSRLGQRGRVKLVCHAEPSNDNGSGREDEEKDANKDASSNGAPPAEVPGGDGQLALSKDVIDKLRATVFTFDSFFVTSVENYDANGVLFKGNLRGKATESQKKLKARLQAQLGEDYVLYLLSDQQDKPCVAVFPAEAISGGAPSPTVEAGLAVLLGLATLGFCLTGNIGTATDDTGAVFEASKLLDGLPTTLALFLLLGAHEAGHIAAARKHGAELAPPLLVPSNLGFLGSFGAVTRIKSTLKNRTQLLEIGLAGPAAGTAASLAMLLVGFGLSIAGKGNVTVDSTAFNDSFLVGCLGHLFLPLDSTEQVQLSPLVIAGWAGLVINALNCIPIGDLDGGRIAFGIWGRRAAGALQVLTTLVLGLGGIIDTLALYWVLFALFIQRGPIVPQEEELSEPEGAAVQVGVVFLALSLMILLPYPGAGDVQEIL
mmetsp:Transcript_32013/g.80858  ORF Transcript_32013/g.80858 Transcript_32013/m.80858 type:complete len:477 (+) Transcript_32013:188-1618(+)